MKRALLVVVLLLAGEGIAWAGPTEVNAPSPKGEGFVISAKAEGSG